MHLQRVQVPDFRVLKNVDISFEKEYTPSIFPLGSQNGGGKSTLLQLIFVLLHCSHNRDKVPSLQNLLYSFKVNDESGKRTLAVIDIWDGSKTVRLDFFTCNESYISNLLNEYTGEEIEFKPSIFAKELSYLDKISQLKEKNKKLQESILRITNIQKEQRYQPIEKEISILKSISSDFQRINYQDYTRASLPELCNKLGETIRNAIKKDQDNLSAVSLELNSLESCLEIYFDFLEFHKTIHISEFLVAEHNTQQEILLCQVENIDIDEAETFLTGLSNKIFLAAHVSQGFLFIPPKYRKLIFKNDNNHDNYYTHLKTYKSQLPGFFTYDFLAIDTIIASFQDAKEQDFRQAVETGNYGNSYQMLLNELYGILVNKRINVEPDLSGVNFKLDKDGTELHPEDLSHGELKRLCIYTWMKHNKIEDAIVLMDELEISFHPDWQYQIVRDLEQWGPSNQYILATHSYELCEAVTPAHVKELEPKLPPRKI